MKNYNLEFSLDTSQSIKLVQFQIKNVQQSQFIDFPLEKQASHYTISKNVFPGFMERNKRNLFYRICR